MIDVNDDKILPHHEQQDLCTTRLPYRQGKKLTAVKVYSINNESRHLLIFGVPSLDLRKEAKCLFSKFGKLHQFILSKQHTIEAFTETYHAIFERIQSARIAKKMLDAKSFYGGLLHICYAPEYEEINETRAKLLQRQKDVIFRLSNLNKQKENTKKNNLCIDKSLNLAKDFKNNITKLNMGEVNTIYFSEQIPNKIMKKKQKSNNSHVIEQKFQPCFVADNKFSNKKQCTEKTIENNDIDVIDFTSVDKEIINNIDEALNYDTFGHEIIRTVPKKPVNRIKFNINNKLNESK